MGNSTSTFCAKCSASLDEDPGCLPADRKPCAACGSTSRRFEAAITVATKPRVSIGMKHKRPGVKKPLAESFSGAELRKSSGDHVEKVRLIDRQNNRYVERVVTETGEVLRDVDHKLTEHVGRGSAKPKAM